MGAKPGGENSVPEDLILVILGYGLGGCGGGKKKKRQSKETNFKIAEGKKRARAHEGSIETPKGATRGKSTGAANRPSEG